MISQFWGLFNAGISSSLYLSSDYKMVSDQWFGMDMEEAVLS
jgi:hypothetical protein